MLVHSCGIRIHVCQRCPSVANAKACSCMRSARAGNCPFIESLHFRILLPVRIEIGPPRNQQENVVQCRQKTQQQSPETATKRSACGDQQSVPSGARGESVMNSSDPSRLESRRGFDATCVNGHFCIVQPPTDYGACRAASISFRSSNAKWSRERKHNRLPLASSVAKLAPARSL